GSPLPGGVVQEGNDLVIRNPHPDQAGSYICTITHPDGRQDRIAVQLDHPHGHQFPGQAGPQPEVAPHRPQPIGEDKLENKTDSQQIMITKLPKRKGYLN
ncbi:unnamed protein product, partial [Adineta steineri]